MKILFLLLFALPAFAQRPASFQYDDGKPTQFNALSVGDHAMVLFQPAAPCFIDSITFAVSATQGGDIEFHLWLNEGGNAFPEVYWDWIPPQTVTLPAAPGVQYVTLAVNPPINNAAVKPFYAGVTIVDANAHLMADKALSPSTCTSSSGGEYFHSYLQNNGQLYYGNGDFVVHANVRFYDESAPHILTDTSLAAGFPKGFAGSKRICWGDYNNDGYEDVFVGATKLFRNNGNGTFTDVTSAAGIDQAGTIAVMADMNNDGWLDIVIEPGQLVYENKHDGTFTKHAGAAPKASSAPTCIAIGDYDNDGKLDYFVGNWEHEYNLNKSDYPSSTDANATELVLGVGYPAYLFHNNGNFSFSDSTSQLTGYKIEDLGYNAYTQQTDQPGYRVVYGAQWSDYNNDGKLDLFVCNYRLQGNVLWKNTGKTFTESGLQSGLIGHIKSAYPGTYGHTIGCDWGDFNNDGNMDIILSQLAHPRFIDFSDRTALYQSSGPPNYTFSDLRYPYDQDTTGVNYEETGTDVAMGDYDNDGNLDFGITAVYGCRYASLYHQKSGGGSFEEQTYYGGIKIADGWGVTWADYDNDGMIDLAMSGDDGFHLFHNDIKNNFHHLAVHLRSYTGNRFGVGARLTAWAGGQRFTREIVAGKGSGSSNPLVAYFGLKQHDHVDSLVITWPDGHIDRFAPVPADSALLATEGNATLHNYRDSLSGVKPHITSIAPKTNVNPLQYPGDTVYTNVPFIYDCEATGTAPLNYYLEAARDGITVSPAGKVRGMIVIPGGSPHADLDIAIAVRNTVGFDNQDILLHVAEGIKPHIAQHQDDSTLRSVLYRDTIHATGNPPPHFSFLTKPGSAVLDTATGIFTWTPSLAVPTNVKVMATNPVGTDTVAYKIYVTRPIGIEAGDENIPDAATLEQNYPNPFIIGGGAAARTTDIAFILPTTTMCELTIFNMIGEKVRSLAQGNLAAGTHVVKWDGKDGRGKNVGAGEYVYVLRSGMGLVRRLLVVTK